MPPEIVREIFIATHLCEAPCAYGLVVVENTLASICLTSKLWYDFAKDVPILWHHLHRRQRQTCSCPMVLRISRAKLMPLHLDFRVEESDEDVDIHPFVHVLEQHALRWRSITLSCVEFVMAQALLQFTCYRALPLLESLIISDDPPVLTHDGSNLLLRLAPGLRQFTISSVHLRHFSPIKSLVDVRLMPCYGTDALLQKLSLSHVQTLYLERCVWASLTTSSPAHFPFLVNLTVQDISWFTFLELLDVLDAPLLQKLSVLLEITDPILWIPLEESLGISSHMPKLTHFAITLRDMRHGLHILSAIIFTCGWAIPTVTHLTTNIPVQFFSAFYTSGLSLIFPARFFDHGFEISESPPSYLDVPSFAFPSLRCLRFHDPHLYMYPTELRKIAMFAKTHKIPLASMTIDTDHFSNYELESFKCHVEIKNWEDEGVELDDSDMALVAQRLLQ